MLPHIGLQVSAAVNTGMTDSLLKARRPVDTTAAAQGLPERAPHIAGSEQACLPRVLSLHHQHERPSLRGIWRGN